MVTLASVQGSSLVPDFAPALEIASEGIERRRKEKLELGQKAEISGLVRGAGSGKPSVVEKALLRLGELNPAIAKSVRETLDRGDVAEQEEIRVMAEKQGRDAVLISRQPTFAKKQQAITALAQDRLSQGLPIDRLIELQNMDESHLDLELQKMQIAATDLQTLLEPAKQPTAKTTIGQAREDLKNGFITKADFKTINDTPGKFQTDVGKLIGDRKLAVDLFGEGTPQVKAIDEAIAGGEKGEAPKLSDVAGARKEFTKLSGDFLQLRDAIGKVRLAAENPSAAGDLSLIFNFMKILDPGSTVREGEFATAQNSAGIPARVRAQYNQVVNGQRLADTQRNDFVVTANRMFQGQLDRQVELEDSFRDLATRQNMDPDNVVIDFIGDSGAALPPGVTEEDIIETMRVNNMTREAVIQRLAGQ